MVKNDDEDDDDNDDDELSLFRGNRRRLVDSCGHERCYSCIGRNEECAPCNQMGQ